MSRPAAPASIRMAAMPSGVPIAATAARTQMIACGIVRTAVNPSRYTATAGIMQSELQEKRQWVSRDRFLEGLSLVNMLPAATATQLGIFLGYARGGWWGGLLAGVCFVLPAFFVILGLTIAYAG